MTHSIEMALAEIPSTHVRSVQADGVKVFYREAGPADAPALLLLHGFPTSSFMFRELIPRLADRYRVIAPDMPGFGFTTVPASRNYAYTFDSLAKTVGAFVEALELRKYCLYIFDYGAPVGLRLAMAHPERVTAIITQNGNAYEDGLGDTWSPIQRYWSEPTRENRDAIRQVLSPEALQWQYTHGTPDPDAIGPESYTLDAAMLARPGNADIQLDLLLNYATNIQVYPEFQQYFREYRPPTLAIWGRNDPFFIPAGAEAYRRDNPQTVVQFLDTGHFALETHAREIASEIRLFLKEK